MLVGRKKRARSNSNVFSLFDQRQIGEFKEAFSLLDQNADGVVDREDLKELLISLGRPSTDAELEEMMADIPRESQGMNFTLFLALMGEKMQDIDSEQDLLAAFEILDERRTGFISVDLLKEYLTRMGDQLTDDEFELMLRGSELDANGHLNYRYFAKALAHADEDI